MDQFSQVKPFFQVEGIRLEGESRVLQPADPQQLVRVRMQIRQASFFTTFARPGQVRPELGRAFCLFLRVTET